MIFAAILVALIVFVFVMFAVDIILHLKKGEDIPLKRGAECQKYELEK